MFHLNNFKNSPVNLMLTSSVREGVLETIVTEVDLRASLIQHW